MIESRNHAIVDTATPQQVQYSRTPSHQRPKTLERELASRFGWVAIVAAIFLLITSTLNAAAPTNAAFQRGLPPRPGGRGARPTSVVPMAQPGAPAPGTRPFTLKTNGVTAARPAAGKTNAVTALKGPGTKPSGTNVAPSLMSKIRAIPSQPAFYPVVIGLIVAIAIIVAFRAGKTKTAKSETAVEPEHAARPLVKRPGKQGFHSCNVLQVTPNASKVWQFDSRYHLNRDLTSVPGGLLPASTRKDWHSLFQRKLN